MPEHFWRIHKRVALRVLSDSPERVRDIIARDEDGRTAEYRWFAKKVNTDATRLFENPDYWDNAKHTFREETDLLTFRR